MRQMFDQTDHVIAEIAEKVGRKDSPSAGLRAGRSSLSATSAQASSGMAVQRAEGLRIKARLAVDLRTVPGNARSGRPCRGIAAPDLAPVTDSSMKVSDRASPSFSIRLTGVSRSAASSRAIWFSPRAQAELEDLE